MPMIRGKVVVEAGVALLVSRRARETVGAVFRRRSEVRSQPILGGSWVLRGGGSALTIPRMGGEVVVEAGVAPFYALLCLNPKH